jgi:hypothetical protein
MTKEQMWENHRVWNEKREFRKKLMKCYPDLGELCEMRHNVSEMINSISRDIDRLIKDDVSEEDDELYTLKDNKKTLTKVYKYIDKDAQKLFEKYGVEDKCQER